MIPRVLSIAIAASLLSSCCRSNRPRCWRRKFLYKELSPNGAITRAKEFCDGQGKSFLAEKIEPASVIEGRSPSILFKCV